MMLEIQIPLRKNRYFVIAGGPYRERPENMIGVKMAEEIRAVCDVDIPTKDFQVPNRKHLKAGLAKAVDFVLAGEPIYVGCMGGIGRTGLFLAILTKAFGVKQPVKFVRKNYLGHAVETKQQQDYVRYFQISKEIKRKIKIARILSYLKFWTGSNLTHRPFPIKVTESEQTLSCMGKVEVKPLPKLRSYQEICSDLDKNS